MGEGESKLISTTSVDGGIKTAFEWTVEKFQKLSSHGVGYSTTKDITVSGSEKFLFSLCVYPHGFNERTSNYVSLWLKKQSAKELVVNFNCAIVDAKGNYVCRKSMKQNMALESVLGWATFCNRHFLLDKTILKEDSLTFGCVVEIFESNFILNAEIEDNPLYDRSLSEISDNLRELLNDKRYSDFALKVGRETLHVHKAVLSARSPVFKTMFQSTLQRDVKQTEIKDIKLEEMEMLVKYIYTGKIDSLSVPTAMGLYYAADKYEVTILRDICSTILSNNLLIDNAIQVLLLADRHSDFQLQESCLCFLDKNLREIKGKPEWIDLMRNFPNLADKALFFKS